MKTTYVFGAGASRDAGYPFAKSMGGELFKWMEREDPSGTPDFRSAATFLRGKCVNVENIELLLTQVDEFIVSSKGASLEKRISAQELGYHKFCLVQALREWFKEIRKSPSRSYELFAQQVAKAGDTVISFNYDVALDRELKLAGLWRLGDGYGFTVESFEAGSGVQLLKLHGSINWLVPIFGGEVSSGGHAFEIGKVFGPRPVFDNSELAFLKYKNSLDPLFHSQGMVGIPPLILPTRCKQFYFDTNLGREFEDFWNLLWDAAATALKKSDHVVVCGYSLPPVDERACSLLFEEIPIQASVDICCGNDTEGVVRRFRDRGYNAGSSDYIHFADGLSQLRD